MRGKKGLWAKRVHLLSAACCLLLSGCMLESAGERGNTCPPGTIKAEKGEKYVAFGTLNCFADYVVIPDRKDNLGRTCRSCSQPDEGKGDWVCDDDLEACLSDFDDVDLWQDYLHCRHYREHGVLDAGSDASMHIAFYQGLNEGVYQSVPESEHNASTCPAKFPVCVYVDDFVDSENEDGARGAFGCTVECTGDLLYCGEGDARRCVNPKLDDEYCGARGSCSGTNKVSSNWIGRDCTIEGLQCKAGKCDCWDGSMICDDSDECVDILSSVDHCGDCDTQCDDGQICIRGVCGEDQCADKGNLCYTSDGECDNSSEACGSSCVDCSAIPHALRVACSTGGNCVIKACEENFHIYRDKNGIYECRKNTLEACGKSNSDNPGDLQNCKKIEHQTGVECRAGSCIVTGCEEGYKMAKDRMACVNPECTGCNSVSERCQDGKCVCAEGDQNCGEAGCVDVKSDAGHCVDCKVSCGEKLKVSSMDGYVAHACVNANCEITECKAQYYVSLDKKTCEKISEDNCGSAGKDCRSIVGVEDAVCDAEHGKCVILQCKPQFHVFGETCEPDSESHCGDHDRSCVGNGVSKGECRHDEGGAAKCVTLECSNGYHTVDNPDANAGGVICEKDDSLNCGSHGKACPQNMQCVDVDGLYTCKCDEGIYRLCGSECVDVHNDPNYCGECSKQCAATQTCANGLCACAGGTSLCDNQCVDQQNDSNHCGSCTTKCESGSKCVAGKCVCTEGATKCDGLNYKVCRNNQWETKTTSGKDLVLSKTAKVFSSPGGNATNTINYSGNLNVKVHYVANYGGKDYLRISSPYNGWVEAYYVNLYGTAVGDYRIYDSNSEGDNTQSWNVYLTKGRRYQLRCGCQRWAPHYGSDVYGWAPDNWFTDKAPDLSGVPRCEL